MDKEASFSQAMSKLSEPDRKSFESALKFYELDHKLTPEDRIALRDYYKEITNKIVAGSWFLFGVGFGFVFYKNRRAIAIATENAKRLSSHNLTQEEIFKNIKKKNNYGVKGFLSGIVTMLLGSPLVNSLAQSSASDNFNAKEEQRKQTSSVPELDNETFGGVDDALSEENSSQLTNAQKVAKLVGSSWSAKWGLYYDLTVKNPGAVIKDPREIMRHRLEQMKQVPSYQHVSKQPNGNSDNAFSINPAVYEQDQQVYENSNTPTISGLPEINVALERSSADISASGFGNYRENDDVSNWGLPAANAENSSSNNPSNNTQYASAWDKIRTPNSSSSGSIGTSDGSSWDEIRRRNGK